MDIQGDKNKKINLGILLHKLELSAKFYGYFIMNLTDNSRMFYLFNKYFLI